MLFRSSANLIGVIGASVAAFILITAMVTSKENPSPRQPIGYRNSVPSSKPSNGRFAVASLCLTPTKNNITTAIQEAIDTTRRSRERYCLQHGYDCVVHREVLPPPDEWRQLDGSIRTHSAPGWQKYVMVHTLLSQGYTGVLAIDCFDAIVTNRSYTLESFADIALASNASIVGAGDGSSGPMSTAVLLYLNTPTTLRILREVWTIKDNCTGSYNDQGGWGAWLCGASASSTCEQTFHAFYSCVLNNIPRHSVKVKAAVSKRDVMMVLPRIKPARASHVYWLPLRQFGSYPPLAKALSIKQLYGKLKGGCASPKATNEYLMAGGSRFEQDHPEATGWYPGDFIAHWPGINKRARLCVPKSMEWYMNVSDNLELLESASAAGCPRAAMIKASIRNTLTYIVKGKIPRRDRQGTFAALAEIPSMPINLSDCCSS